MDTSPQPGGFALQPFRALRLAHSRVSDPVSGRVFARPYRAVPGRLQEWRRKRHLELDEHPALYVHEYTSNGISIRGIVAAVDLAATAGRVFPHEGVHEAQVDQLAQLMSDTSLNPAPILLMHRGPESARVVLRATCAGDPHLVYTDRGDQLQRVWRITNPEHVADLSAALAGTQAVVADGHHRLAAAHRLRSAHPQPGWDQPLGMLVDQDDTPLQLCAIHRAVPRCTLEDVEAAARESGDRFVRRPSSHQALARLDHALVLHDGSDWATLEPSGPTDLLVTWLHEEVLPRWGTDPERLEFHHSASAALDRARHGLSVLLPAPTFDHVEASARSGHLLPQKATSFQPKPHLGVLMRDVRDG